MMKSDHWQITRITLIGLSVAGAILVLLQSFIDPNFTQKKIVHNISFPQSVPLDNWQETNANPVKPKSEKQAEGYQYNYQNQTDNLEIETRYEIYTDGNVNRLLMVYKSIPPATVQLQVKQKDNMGYYSLFEYQDRAYLSACVNPKGQTTVNGQQFTSNRYRHNWSIPRVFLWTIGQKDLFDGRCLWTVMSIPIDSYENENALSNAYQALETAWFDWHSWWQDNYPN